MRGDVYWIPTSEMVQSEMQERGVLQTPSALLGLTARVYAWRAVWRASPIALNEVGGRLPRCIAHDGPQRHANTGEALRMILQIKASTETKAESILGRES